METQATTNVSKRIVDKEELVSMGFLTISDDTDRSDDDYDDELTMGGEDFHCARNIFDIWDYTYML